MAIEKYTVFYNIRDGGNQGPLLWKEKLYLDTRALFRRIWEKLT